MQEQCPGAKPQIIGKQRIDLNAQDTEIKYKGRLKQNPEKSLPEFDLAAQQVINDGVSFFIRVVILPAQEIEARDVDDTKSAIGKEEQAQDSAFRLPEKGNNLVPVSIKSVHEKAVG